MLRSLQESDQGILPRDSNRDCKSPRRRTIAERQLQINCPPRRGTHVANQGPKADRQQRMEKHLFCRGSEHRVGSDVASSPQEAEIE